MGLGWAVLGWIWGLAEFRTGLGWVWCWAWFGEVGWAGLDWVLGWVGLRAGFDLNKMYSVRDRCLPKMKVVYSSYGHTCNSSGLAM